MQKYSQKSSVNEEETQEGNKIGGESVRKCEMKELKAIIVALRKRRRVVVLKKKQNTCWTI